MTSCAVSRATTAAVLAVCLVGCDLASPSVALPLTPLDAAGSTGIFSGIADRRSIVVRDRPSFEALWAEIHRHHSVVPTAPDVEFATDMVVGFAMGEQPTSGFGVTITGVSRGRSGFRIEVEETQPSAACALLPVITAPVALARLTRTDEPIEFITESAVEDCGN